MTRVRIAVCILAALILMSAGSVFAVRRCCDHLLSSLHQLSAAEEKGDSETAKELCRSTLEQWDSVQWILKLCVSYDKLGEAEITLQRLEPMIESDCDELGAELMAAETMLRHISEEETPYLTNVF